MVKKIIIGVLLLLLAIGGYFLGKSFYYNKIYNYSKVIDESMEEYYKSNDTEDIDSIRELLRLYEDNEEILEDIENKSFNVFTEWYEYTNDKYTCTLESVNECILYKKELEDLSNRLSKLSVYYLFPVDKTQFLLTQIDNEIKKTKEIIEDPKASRGETYEEHRKATCSKVKDEDCELQRDGTSICVYTLGTIKETVVCKKVYNSK